MTSLKRALPLLALSALGCGETPPKVQLRSLQASGDVTAVCRSSSGQGLPLSSCPDYEFGQNQLLALVTQTLTEEVALVQLASGTFVDLDDGRVIDIDPSMPGFNFLRLPGRPGEIVSSPGGVASFVTVTSVGREGVVGLPTSCMSQPRAAHDDVAAESRRDLTSFPACSLPSAPGSIAVVIDPVQDDDSTFASCDRSLGAEEPSTSPGAVRGECGGDLTAELGPRGRRKLAVALPDLGQIAVIDAQKLLDREPGSYAPCEIEVWVPLSVDLPAAAVDPVLPEDLVDASCPVTAMPPLPRPSTFPARPAGFALSDEGRLYVGDSEAPVVHVLDAQNPCAMSELSPLLPQSFENPDRVVTTSRLAVSPLTPQGKRFVYAIDEYDQPGASVMVFDVSPGSTERTPIVRQGTPRLPLEPADRIGFSSAALDVGFVLRDLPANDPDTGIATTGLLCEPDPNVSSPAVFYRPSTDFTSGARPALLRGVFGFVMLSSGQVVVIDAEDFDAPCRRPITTGETFRGCGGDEGLPSVLTNTLELDGVPVVTNEVSCTVVEPHRARAAQPAINDSRVGVRAPTLRAFPQFSTPDPAAQTGTIDRPKLLAVPFAGGAQPLVYIGSDLYAAEPEMADVPVPPNDLELDPLLAEQNSVTLPLEQPRSYASEEVFALTYEGHITGNLPSGFLDLSSGESSLEDSSANFCDRGVYGVDLMREYGAEHFELEGDALEAFARRHADYAQIIGDFPGEDESYWGTPRGLDCGGREICEATFGPFDAPELSPLRELRVLEATQGRLMVEPRVPEPGAEADVARLLDCCFPTGVPYTIRASQQWVLGGSISGFRHDVVPLEVDGTPAERFKCGRDCSPRKRYFNSRVFELSNSGAGCGELPEEEIAEGCPVGPATGEDQVCTYDASGGPVGLDQPQAACIVDSLNARFAVYRGRTPSERGMSFAWTTAGGFIPLALSLTAQSASVLPQSMFYLPELQHLAVVDASSLGLTLFSLDSLIMEAAFF